MRVVSNVGACKFSQFSLLSFRTSTALDPAVGRRHVVWKAGQLPGFARGTVWLDIRLAAPDALVRNSAVPDELQLT